MNKRDILKYAVINALGTALYVIAIASFMSLGEKGFFGTNETVFVPITMLMLFVFSTAFTGALVFGRPITWYLDGKKQEALYLLITTLGIFLIVTIIFFLFLIALV